MLHAGNFMNLNVNDIRKKVNESKVRDLKSSKLIWLNLYDLFGFQINYRPILFVNDIVHFLNDSMFFHVFIL